MDGDPRFRRLLALRREAAELEQELGLELDTVSLPEIIDPLGLAVHRLLCEMGRDMVAIHSTDGKFQFVSGNAKHLFGYHPEDLIGHHPEEFFADPALYEATPGHITYLFKCADGTHKWVRTSVRENFIGERRQLVTMTSDIHEQHLAEGRRAPSN